MDYIQLSEFPPNSYVLIDKEQRYELFERLEKKYRCLRRAGKKIDITPGELYFWRLGHQMRKNGKSVKRYIPLLVLKKICKDLGTDVNDLQYHVSEIKTNSRSGTIKRPKLPLAIMPETFAVLGHLLADGYGGERGNACYVNTSREALNSFVCKIVKAFGDVNYSINYKHNRVVISKLVPRILKKYFQIRDFRSSASEITKKVSNAPKPYLIEFLRAIIIDEGRVSDSGIYLEFSANLKMTRELHKICEKRLGYICYSCKKNFIISNRSFPVVIKDLKDLVIGDKNKMLFKWFNRRTRKWYNRKRGETKKDIINLLRMSAMSVKEMSIKLNIKDESVRTQIHGYNLRGKYVPGLIDLGLVEGRFCGYRNTKLFGIRDKEKAISYSNG